MTPIVRAVAVAAAALIPLSLTACSLIVDPDPAASASAPSSATATAEQEAYTSASVPDLGLTIAVPSHWQTIAPEAVSNPVVLEQVAGATGLSTEILEATLADTEFVAIDPAPAQGTVGTLHVADMGAGTGTPDQDALTATVSDLGGTVTGSRQADTAQGTATVVSYTAEDSGTTVHGTVIAAPTPDGRDARISVLTGSQEDTDSLTEAILDSLA